MHQFVAKFNQRTQILLDKAAPLILPRWVLWAVTLLAYAVRVWMLKGFYIVTYGLGIYNLNLLLGFITPQVDPELEHDAPALPTKSDQEFKPFVRRLPEFKFWCVLLDDLCATVQPLSCTGIAGSRVDSLVLLIQLLYCSHKSICICCAAGGHQ